MCNESKQIQTEKKRRQPECDDFSYGYNTYSTLQ